MRQESLAMRRAREREYGKDSTWYCQFKYSPVFGLGYEEGIHRRDPSSVIKVGDIYYVWYTKSTGPSVGYNTGDLEAKVWPWDWSDVWYATSNDGVSWNERGLAVGRGERGAYDDRSVFTPEVLAYDGRYYLVYQVVQHPYLRRSKEYIGMAHSDSPNGPWVKMREPILSPADNGEWFGDADNRHLVTIRGDFDSHKTNDPCLFYYHNQFWLYYKGYPMGEQLNCAGRETKWGVAVADRPEGPYVKSEYNPITNSGHETLLWPYRGGIAALLTTDGPERNTIQYAPDGLQFGIEAYIEHPPEAGGPYRSELTDQHPLEGVRWGLSHEINSRWHYIKRFDVDEKTKHLCINKFNH
ncbi:glycoside hydrolase family 117 protein [Paenibacillus ferrarius]|uniref:glycoside hydrolase family 117 protein n=1 Tax=Paenibacillus ferrarius TaxID=1469647 RepID=UPI003D2D4F08